MDWVDWRCSIGQDLKAGSLAVSLLNQGYEHRMKRKVQCKINETETLEMGPAIYPLTSHLGDFDVYSSLL